MSVYSSSKAAVRSFARTFTTDLKDRKIRVDAISPDVIPSPGYRNSLGMTEEQIKQYADSVVGNIPLGRTGTLDEVAKVVSFLASDENSYVNPTVYSVAEFKLKLASGNHFLNAVLKGKKAFVLGDEDDLRKVGRVRLAKTGSYQSR